jgi:hypothetical protein
MTTSTAFPGRGSYLSNGGTTGSPYTRVAQLRKFGPAGGKAEFDDITNLDSPTIFKEYLKTLADGSAFAFDGVLNSADPTFQSLFVNLAAAGSAALDYWQVTLSDGSVVVFQGYVEAVDFGVEYNKALAFKGSIKIVGAVTATWI